MGSDAHSCLLQELWQKDKAFSLCSFSYQSRELPKHTVRRRSGQLQFNSGPNRKSSDKLFFIFLLCWLYYLFQKKTTHRRAPAYEVFSKRTPLIRIRTFLYNNLVLYITVHLKISPPFFLSLLPSLLGKDDKLASSVLLR
mmetsp:Transcript_1861/g.4126  ORF Transcript_1861/g.4126 Transcript_1861/m.4126 type:complete len:140 (-) Transcript_1861:202-621(-)